VDLLIEAFMGVADANPAELSKLFGEAP
jgi:hypothetical protein